MATMLSPPMVYIASNDNKKVIVFMPAMFVTLMFFLLTISLLLL